MWIVDKPDSEVELAVHLNLKLTHGSLRHKAKAKYKWPGFVLRTQWIATVQVAPLFPLDHPCLVGRRAFGPAAELHRRPQQTGRRHRRPWPGCPRRFLNASEQGRCSHTQ